MALLPMRVEFLALKRHSFVAKAFLDERRVGATSDEQTAMTESNESSCNTNGIQ